MTLLLQRLTDCNLSADLNADFQVVNGVHSNLLAFLSFQVFETKVCFSIGDIKLEYCNKT